MINLDADFADIEHLKMISPVVHLELSFGLEMFQLQTHVQ